ncbi:LysR family transcriptional regulator, partial [Burkholderia vietnamiensis]
MELHQLEAFSAVMSAGSVTGAGELLGRSQPAVTRQIQELEADLGYALFDRHGPRVTPTRRAFLLYDEVERSLVGLRAIEARARALGDETAEPVRIAATPSLAAALVPAAL